jgi:hypothetical protein
MDRRPGHAYYRDEVKAVIALGGSAGERRRALDDLAARIRDAEDHGYVRCAFELRLIRGLARAQDRASDAEAELDALAEEAAAKGYALIAREARSRTLSAAPRAL